MVTPPNPPSVVSPPVSSTTKVDWSMNGHNWADDMCVTGRQQSPVNIDTKTAKENSKVKFSFDF